MLAAQRYRSETVPPCSRYVQFGDDILGRGVSAHSAALQRLAEKRLPGLHAERLRGRGVHPLTPAEHPLHRPDPLQVGVETYDMATPRNEPAPETPIPSYFQPQAPESPDSVSVASPHTTPATSRISTPREHSADEGYESAQEPGFGHLARSGMARAASSAALLPGYAARNLQNKVMGTLELGRQAGVGATHLLRAARPLVGQTANLVGSAGRRAGSGARSAGRLAGWPSWGMVQRLERQPRPLLF